MPERLVVIGGDAAGMSAASQARRMRPASDLEIVAFERSSWVSYSACGEPYYVAGYVEELTDLIARTPEEFAARDIEVRTWHEVTAIDTARREVTVRDLAGKRDFTVGYDTLMYATGAAPNRPPIEGRDLLGVHEIHTLDDAEALRTVIERERPRHAVIVGGGYIGVEMAEALHALGIETVIATMSDSLLDPQLDPDMGDLVRAAAEGLGIEVQTRRRIETILGRDGHVRAVQCCEDETGAERREYPADIVVLGLGSHPEVTLAESSGIPLGPSGAVSVDDHQRTKVEGVYAAGDCAEALHRVSGRAVNFHLGTIANKMGRVAGINIGGGDAAFPGVLGTAITKVCELEVARTGLTETEARNLDYDLAVETFESTTAVGYWPDTEALTMKVIAERPTGRLLGAQIVGGAGAGKRIDTFAMALWNEMTAADVVNVDLSYAPPFSGVWDPVLVGARKLEDALRG